MVELQEVEEERRKAVAGSKKRSAELLEQSNHDGTKLIEASMAQMNLGRSVTASYTLQLARLLLSQNSEVQERPIIVTSAGVPVLGSLSFISSLSQE